MPFMYNILPHTNNINEEHLTILKTNILESPNTTNMKLTTLTRSILILGILLTATQTYSQQLISGSVIDTEGKNIVFASIIENNTSFGTTTNEKGIFTLNINKFPTTVTISSPYHKQKTITLGKKHKMTIVLQREERKISSVE